MDWVGQRRAEAITLYAVVALAVVAFLAGFATQDFLLMMKIYGVGVALTAAVVIPDWPAFNKDPLTWLPAKQVAAATKKDDDGGAADQGAAEPDDDAPSGSGAGSPSTRQRRLPVIE